MASTAQQLGSFQDPYNYQTPGTTEDSMAPLYGHGSKVPQPNSITSKVGDWLGLTNRQAEYEQWSRQQDRDYERANINSARAWEEYLDSTKYQRMKADLEAAGLNPWLALQSGLSGSSQAASTNTGGSSSAKSSKSSSSGLRDAALGLLAVAKLIALIA